MFFFALLLSLVNFSTAAHSNNWALLVDTSKFWFNYRHVANVLSIYRSIKRLGIPDSHIILMLADDAACNPRNPRPATVYHNSNQKINIYGDDVEVDYRGYEVTAENVIRILTGRVQPGTPQSKQLLLDENSNLLFYMTGHGGDGFLKFQDTHEISDQELADTFQQMYHKRRYNSLLFIIETCRAASMLRYLYSPNVIGFACSRHDEESYSHHSDSTIGVHVIDRFSHYMLEFLEKIDSYSQVTLSSLLECCSYQRLHSHTVSRTDLYSGDTKRTLVTDFFGSARSGQLVDVPSYDETLLFALNSPAYVDSPGQSASVDKTAIDEKETKEPEADNKAATLKSPPASDVIGGSSRTVMERRSSNMMTNKSADDGHMFAVVVFFGLVIYILVSAYEKQSRHKTASFDFIPDGLLPATCFSPHQ